MSMMILGITARPRTLSYGRRNHRAVSAAYYQESRIYVHPEGETIMDNLMNRRTRPYNDYRKLLADLPFMPGARWSQKAGCKMCPCSPGFIAKRRFSKEGFPVDYHVTVMDEREFYNAVGSIAQMMAEVEAEPAATYLDLVAA